MVIYCSLKLTITKVNLHMQIYIYKNKSVLFAPFISLDSLVVVMPNLVHGYITFLQFYALVLQFYSILIVVSPYLWYKRTLDKSNRIIVRSVKRSCKLYKQLQLLTHNNITFFYFLTYRKVWFTRVILSSIWIWRTRNWEQAKQQNEK